MTRRQVTATLALAAVVAAAGISVAFARLSRGSDDIPVEVGVIHPQPLESDSLAGRHAARSARKSPERQSAPASDNIDQHDSPLYHPVTPN